MKAQRLYALPLSGKVARRRNFADGASEISIDDNHPFIRRPNAGHSWVLCWNGRVHMQSKTLNNVLRSLDILSVESGRAA